MRAQLLDERDGRVEERMTAYFVQTYNLSVLLSKIYAEEAIQVDLSEDTRDGNAMQEVRELINEELMHELVACDAAVDRGTISTVGDQWRQS